jgi:hypothetical protein
MLKTLLFAIILASLLSVPGQNGPRVFDNFDRSQGVPIYLSPAPAANLTAKRTRKKGSKWVVKIEDPLVKKTALTGPTVSVSDGLAQRETVVYPSATKLAMGTSTHLKGFTTGSDVVDSYIVDSSRRYSVDPLLIYSQMHQESTFKARALSPKGASGLMQLMPATARRFGVSNIWDARQNIDAGVKYMRWLLDTFNGDVVLALAGYNAGEGAVMKYGWRVPPYRETQEYVRRITSRYGAISDGRYVQTARRVSSAVAAKLERNVAKPLTVFEPDPLTVRLPDGKMILVNQ